MTCIARPAGLRARLRSGQMPMREPIYRRRSISALRCGGKRATKKLGSERNCMGSRRASERRRRRVHSRGSALGVRGREGACIRGHPRVHSRAGHHGHHARQPRDARRIRGHPRSAAHLRRGGQRPAAAPRGRRAGTGRATSRTCAAAASSGSHCLAGCRQGGSQEMRWMYSEATTQRERTTTASCSAAHQAANKQALTLRATRRRAARRSHAPREKDPSAIGDMCAIEGKGARDSTVGSSR